MKASRLAATGAVAASAVVVLSSPAFAHVSVQPEGTAAKGGYAVIDFKVPNERDDASTTKLEVNFPTDHPLASVMPQPMDGWKIKVTKSKLAKPIEMHGEKIDRGRLQGHLDRGGQGRRARLLPEVPRLRGHAAEDADELVFKALQTYSDKEVVRWIEVQKDGAEEPENPAPVLALSAASEDGHSTARRPPRTPPRLQGRRQDTENTAADTAASADSSDTTARVLAVVGIVVGALGVAYGVLAGRRRSDA